MNIFTVWRSKKLSILSSMALFIVTTAVQADTKTDATDPLQWPAPCSAAVQNEVMDANVRLPAQKITEMTSAQRIAVKAVNAGPRGCLYGPFVPLSRSPELLTRTQLLGVYIRFHAALPAKLREMTVLIVGKEWNQPYIWYIHEPEAIHAGLSRNIIDSIEHGVRPQHMSAETSAVYDFSTQLLTQHKVDDTTYQRVKDLFGEQGVVDLTSMNGYFSNLAMILSVAKTPLPKGVNIQFSNKASSY